MRLAALGARVLIPFRRRPHRPGPAGPSVPVHRLADHRGGRPPGPRRLSRIAGRGTGTATWPGPPSGPPLEGGVPQTVGPGVVLGRAGFADDTCPAGALVAVPDGAGGYAVAESLGAARALAGKVQGRKTSLAARPPGGRAPRPTGTSPCRPPGSSRPTSSRTPRGAPPAASRPRPSATAGPSAGSCAHRWPPTPAGWPTATVARSGSSGPARTWCATAPNGHRWPRGINADGSGVLRVAVPLDGLPGDRWARVVADVASVAPGLVLEPVPALRSRRLLRPAGRGVGRGRRPGRLRPVAGERRRPDRRRRACRGDRPGRRAGPRPAAAPTARSRWWCEAGRGARRGGAPVLLHWAPPTRPWAGWAARASPWTPAGVVHDLTMRSFGILPARDMPPVTVVVGADGDRPPVNGSDAVFAAVAAARWLADGLPPRWPTGSERSRTGAGRPPSSPVAPGPR